MVVVATDAILTKAQAKRLAVMAQTGVARAIYPVHTPLDGDVLFAAATGRKALSDPLHACRSSARSRANVTARAIARAVYEATALSLSRRAAELERQIRPPTVTTRRRPAFMLIEFPSPPCKGLPGCRQRGRE